MAEYRPEHSWQWMTTNSSVTETLLAGYPSLDASSALAARRPSR
ncbi:hypothetical protein AKJ09_04035 [Labilithrix luteola]|uniref:Uncharacterized protein n=1 Tax=Labilithrix luteola TaxID=1391654 RepID=A0A0K1PVH5_9BACT|nr:hypothetical protein AKJ09_04035 [Labilithrix luteola]